MAAGSVVNWEPLGGGQGRISMASNDPRALDLLAAANRHMGGIVLISQSQYEDLKKKYPFVPKSRPSDIQPIRRHEELFPTIPKKVRAAQVAAINPGVMTPPKPPKPPAPPAPPTAPTPAPMPAPNPILPARTMQAPIPTAAPPKEGKPWAPPVANPPSIENPPAPQPFKPRRGRPTNAMKAAMTAAKLNPTPA